MLLSILRNMSGKGRYKNSAKRRGRSWCWHYPAICPWGFSLLTDKSGSGVFLYLHLRRTDCDRKYVWTGEARRRSRLFGCCRRWIRGLLRAGWMSVLTVCLHCLYRCRLPDSIHGDSQSVRLSPGNDHEYAKCSRRQCPLWWWIWYVMEWSCGLSSISLC